jgi:DNA polymerase-3 subunit epsilon
MLDYRIPYHDLHIANQWECTLKIYKAKGYKPANLNACCQKHGIRLQHHEALSDARACGQLFLLAQS